MFKSIKKKFWNFIIPRIANKLRKREQLELSLKKERILSGLQSRGVCCQLNGHFWIFREPKKIILGNNIHIGDNFYAAGDGGLIIGDNTHISRNVTIYTTNHNYTGKSIPYDNTNVYKPVVIKNNVWIGMNVSILPGVTIDEGAIIGMGSVVNRDIKKNEIVGNNSLISIKFRDSNHYNLLKKNKSFGGVNGRPLCKNEIETFLPSYNENRNKKIIFILGTGRSGSNSIVNILNQNPNCIAFHEDIKQLIRISTKLAECPENKNEYFEELINIFNTKIWQTKKDQILIHSDQRLWNLIPFLKEYFPNSKFIHLKRDKYSCIKSMYARNWYYEDEYPKLVKHDWAKYRLKADKINEMSNEKWSGLSSLEKCTWYWGYVNLQINIELAKIEKSRTLTLNLKDLELDKLKWSKFINDDNFNYKIIKTNQVKKQHLIKYNNLNDDELRTKIDLSLEKFGFM